MVHLEPSLEAARRYLGAGQLERARTELVALDAKAGEKPRSRELAAAWRELRAWPALHAATCAEATRALAEVEEPQVRRIARERADGLALQAAEQAVRARRYAMARHALQCGSRELRRDSRTRQLSLTIAAELGLGCIEEQDWDCALKEASTLLAMKVESDAEGLLVGVQQGLKRELDEMMSRLDAEEDPLDRRVLAVVAVRRWALYLEITAGADRLQGSPYEARLAHLAFWRVPNEELRQLVKAYRGEPSERQRWEQVLRERMEVSPRTPWPSEVPEVEARERAPASWPLFRR
jgi:hypothetical protein